MSIYGIDVSAYNGRINWTRVREAGCGFAVIKITRRDGRADSRFAENWRGCTGAGIPCDVYRYVYEATPKQALEMAQAVIDRLGEVKAPAGTRVWWDLEDESIRPHLEQERQALRESILAARGKIELAGYRFGIYTGLWWYRSVLERMNLDCPWWIARYPSSRAMAFGAAPNESYRPQVAGTLWGWQYSSAGQVPGISHSTDLNLIYGLEGAAPVPQSILRRGDRGAGVRWVQERLNRCGANLAVDGIYGPKTEAAVVQFQRENGLTADGIVGPRTRAKLYSRL